jgi:hypothetical protein
MRQSHVAQNPEVNAKNGIAVQQVPSRDEHLKMAT